MDEQASIELQGTIVANDRTASVDHAQFLQEFQQFLTDKSWTFVGSTKQLAAELQVMTEIIPEAE